MAPDVGVPTCGRGEMRTQDAGNRARIAALTGGDPAAVAQFLKDIAPLVWKTCVLLSGSDAQAREAFLEAFARLRAGNFALLADYPGRGTLEDFVALKTRDLLGGRMLQLLQSDREKGWRAFEALFKTDLLRLIHRRLPGAQYVDARHEAYQDICVAMVESDYRRLKAYRGNGSFAGFVLRSADRLLSDFLRGLGSRRRFARRDQDGVRLVRSSPDSPEFADTPDVSPESELLHKQEDVELAAALGVLTRAVETLPEGERLYLTIALSGEAMTPAREIARLMQCPVEEIYKLKQRVLRHLFDLIAEDSAVKNWRASV